MSPDPRNPDAEAREALRDWLWIMALAVVVIAGVVLVVGVWGG